jgi:hypothetical protein
MSGNEKADKESQITLEFGLDTKNYKTLTNLLSQNVNSTNKVFNEAFNAWKSVFKSIYGNAISKELFLNHTYYFLLLKFLIAFKLGQDFLNLGSYFTEEDKLFNWAQLKYQDILKVLNLSIKIEFKEEDLFNQLYQQVFSSSTRHLRGEYYTGSKLAGKMVINSYEFGDRVLDPSCGSGIFIIEILKVILSTEKEYESLIKAIQNVFGFDINPLAIFTCKVNFLLILSNHLSVKDLFNINLNLKTLDSLFPNKKEIEKLKHSFNLVIGNPPWLTYKDLKSKNYQNKVRNLAESLEIKPMSQYTTHIELAAIFFYHIATEFLKINGTIFFVMTKSCLNGDHCQKFRAFKKFKNLEIWDFPDNYFFNVNHVCLKATYIGNEDKSEISEKYPISAKIFDDNLNLKKESYYDSIEIVKNGARVILPITKITKLRKAKQSIYKKLFWQGATLVPRSLIFFEIEKKEKDFYTIKPDLDVISRAKQNWKIPFKPTKIEKNFRFITFLNKDLVPFCIKRFRNVFLPVERDDFELHLNKLEANPLANKFYKEQDKVYKNHKKATSSINTLFENLNYWNKLTKQSENKSFVVVYNASGSNLKSAVIINTKRKIIIGSENYYFSTSSQYEAYYLSAILNSPVLSKNIKIIKSSRHIHKRPFSFAIPRYDDTNSIHRSLGTKAKKYHTVVQDLVLNNPKISTAKIRMFIHPKLNKMDSLVNEIVFN